MNNYGTEHLIAFATSLIKEYFEISISSKITNTDYEGELKEKGDTIKIAQLSKLGLRKHNAQYTTPDKLKETVKTFQVDQDYGFYYELDDLDTFVSMIKNPKGTTLETNAQTLKEFIDAYNLQVGWQNAKAGNRIGTAYITGTVSIDTSGNVTGSGTTFTADMVGRGFKAVGHTKTYKIVSRASNTAIVIKQDLDNDSIVAPGLNAYDGGALTGVAFSIEATSPITVTKSNIYTQLVLAKNILDKWKVPTEGRYCILPSDIANLLNLSDQLIHATQAGDQQIRDGKLPIKLAGFTLYQNEQVTYDTATGGYRCLAGHPNGITHAMALTRQDTEPAIGRFGTVYKDLWLWASDVPDERKKDLVEIFIKPDYSA